MAYRIDYTEMKRLRDAGVKNADIAAALGCDETTVTNAARRFGWSRRKPGQRREIDVAKLFKLWHSEMETPDIAVALGVSISTLWSLRQRHGLPKRPRAAVTLVADPTPEEIAKRAKECRERHYAERRGETDETTLQWRRGGAA
jgi:uncharacterized protein YjcR